jgi:hypothetical protein
MRAPIVLSAIAVFLYLTYTVTGGVTKPPSNNPGVPWPATDALGRSLPLVDELPAPRTDKFVGIFYFLWHNNRGGKSPHWQGPYDISKILQKDSKALTNPQSPFWGPIGMYHYWGEPLYGYYLSDDAWVLRRHAQLLADAGIDTLIFDTTNAVTYRNVYRALCEVFRQARQDGERTPQITFMVNTKAGETAQKIYDDLYRQGAYRELWFNWQGKPLMICDPEKASDQVRDFFTLRRAHWPFTMVNTPYAWHWEAAYPQPYGFTIDEKKPEQVNVSVAQNLRRSDGKVTNMSSGEARGRSFHQGKVELASKAVDYGHNFQEQWRRAFELNPPFVMITGWNEWIAGRWGKLNGPLVFVDQFDQEYSRDIEPAKVGHTDNYYWQMVANVRRYKGAPRLPAASPPKTIILSDGFMQWLDVLPEYRDHVGETKRREHDGVAGLRYINRTGRNDIMTCKVARDQQQLYFYVRSKRELTSYDDDNWMWLLIDVDQDMKTGWQGYDFIVNHRIKSESQTWLEKHVSNWRWEASRAVDYHVEGPELHISIPRAALGLKQAYTSFDFKWVDNMQIPGEIMDFYISGDVAPEGRFKYRYCAD